MYNLSNADSLARSYLNESQLIHDFHGCFIFENNCTAEEIASQQWGSSNITKDFYGPYKATSFLKDTGVSAAIIWPIFNKEPEYYFYAQEYLKGDDLFHIPASSVGRIMNNVTGLTDLTKTAIFIINVTQGINLDVYQA